MDGRRRMPALHTTGYDNNAFGDSALSDFVEYRIGSTVIEVIQRGQASAIPNARQPVVH